jgi:hypothetical protein
MFRRVLRNRFDQAVKDLCRELRYRLEVPADPAKRTSDDEEFLMSTYEIVEAWKREQRQAGIQEGLQEGWQEGRREALQQAILVLHEARFGALPEDLAALVRAEHDDATLYDWLMLTGTGTADEVAARSRTSREAAESSSPSTPSAG